jgi:hypothetical protein
MSLYEKFLKEQRQKEVGALYLRSREFWAEMERRKGVSLGLLDRSTTWAQSRQVLHNFNRSIVLGKEITVRDSRRAVEASFWENRGPSAQLWDMADSQVAGADSQVAGDGVARLASPAFADLWSVTTVQAEYPAACMFLCWLLRIIKPRVVLAMSNPTNNALQSGGFDQLPDDDDSPVLELVDAYCASSGKGKGQGDSKSDSDSDGDGEGMIQRSGQIYITDIGSGHRTIVIPMIHPGYFAYSPAFQRLLYPVYGFTIALFRYVRARAERSPSRLLTPTSTLSYLRIDYRSPQVRPHPDRMLAWQIADPHYTESHKTYYKFVQVMGHWRVFGMRLSRSPRPQAYWRTWAERKNLPSDSSLRLPR